MGGRFAYPDLYEETPDTLTTLYEFDKFNLVWDSAMGIDNGSYGRDHGIAYIGNNGTLILNRGGWEVIEERQSKNKMIMPFQKPSDNGLEKHWENFVGVVKSRKMQTCIALSRLVHMLPPWHKWEIFLSAAVKNYCGINQKQLSLMKR